MINTLVLLIVIMPYNHSYDRQLLIPASLECFSLSQIHKVDGANMPALHTHTHTHALLTVCGHSFGLLCAHLIIFFFKIYVFERQSASIKPGA